MPAGEFEPECVKWVTLRTGGEHAGKLVLTWPKGDDKIYERAYIIRGSRWDNGSMVVPIKSHAEVEDFANLLGFGISEGARAAIQAFVDAKNKPVAPVKRKKPKEADKLSEILNSSREIIPDLLDK